MTRLAKRRTLWLGPYCIGISRNCTGAPIIDGLAILTADGKPPAYGLCIQPFANNPSALFIASRNRTRIPNPRLWRYTPRFVTRTR